MIDDTAMSKEQGQWISEETQKFVQTSTGVCCGLATNKVVIAERAVQSAVLTRTMKVLLSTGAIIDVAMAKE